MCGRLKAVNNKYCGKQCPYMRSRKKKNSKERDKYSVYLSAICDFQNISKNDMVKLFYAYGEGGTEKCLQKAEEIGYSKSSIIRVLMLLRRAKVIQNYTHVRVKHDVPPKFKEEVWERLRKDNLIQYVQEPPRAPNFPEKPQ